MRISFLASVILRICTAAAANDRQRGVGRSRHAFLELMSPPRGRAIPPVEIQAASSCRVRGVSQGSPHRRPEEAAGPSGCPAAER